MAYAEALEFERFRSSPIRTVKLRAWYPPPVGPAHRQEHWDIMNGFLAEAREIQGEALRAHNY